MQLLAAYPQGTWPGPTVEVQYPEGTRQGCCFMCRSSLRSDMGISERCVDTGFSVDTDDSDLPFLGHLVACETCVVEMARLLGMVSPDQRDEAIEMKNEARAEAQWLADENAALKALVDGLRRVDGLAPVAQRPVCDACGFEAMTDEGLAAHMRAKHGPAIEDYADPDYDPDFEASVG